MNGGDIMIYVVTTGKAGKAPSPTHPHHPPPGAVRETDPQHTQTRTAQILDFVFVRTITREVFPNICFLQKTRTRSERREGQRNSHAARRPATS
jgi:hypothetical protein